MPKRLLLIFVLLCAGLVSAGNLSNKSGVIKKDKQTEILTSAISIFSGNGWSQPQGAMLQTNQGENTKLSLAEAKTLYNTFLFIRY